VLQNDDASYLQVEVQVEDFKVDNEEILFQTSKTNVEAMSQIVTWELDAFYRHHVNVENYKCSLFWWRIHEQRWPMVGSLV
jgi:hypothetical protein